MRRFTRIRRSRRVCAVVCIAWIMALEWGGLGFAAWRWGRASRERGMLEVRRETLGSGLPALSIEALKAANIEHEQMGVARVALRDACGVRRSSAPPKSRSRAFFEITRQVERLRVFARERGVACREDERFGFASYAGQGPSLDTLGRVHRQSETAGALLEALFEARPHGFERLQRNDPSRAGRQARGGREEADYFAFVDEPVLAVPADTEAETFRIIFVSHTRALRTWLNDLAGMPGPVVVRDLQVEPARATGAEPDAVRVTVIVQVFFLRAADAVTPTEAALTQVSR